MAHRKQQNMPLAKKIKDHCRKFTAFMFSNIGIIFLVVLYTIGGEYNITLVHFMKLAVLVN